MLNTLVALFCFVICGNNFLRPVLSLVLNLLFFLVSLSCKRKIFGCVSGINAIGNRAGGGEASGCVFAAEDVVDILDESI